MKQRKKIKSYAVYTKGVHKDKQASPELSLLNSRALLAVKNFTHYGADEYAKQCMKKLFKDYRLHKDKVRAGLIGAFEYIHENIPISEDVETAAKKEINSIAKEVWA